jgi:hypothetical protein
MSAEAVAWQLMLYHRVQLFSYMGIFRVIRRVIAMAVPKGNPILVFRWTQRNPQQASP